MDLFRVVVWTLRLVVPFVVFAYYFYPAFLASIYESAYSMLARWTHFSIPGQLMDHRQVKTVEPCRPTFKVDEECVEEDLAVVLQVVPVSRTQLTRETMLAARCSIKMLSEYMCMFAINDGVSKIRDMNVSSLSVAGISGTLTEREYLQSLLQFRAVKLASFNHTTWEAWNEEAQKILKGATMFKCKGVATEVYDTLTEVGVLPDEETFTSLVHFCLISDDVVNAKLFLAEMINAGYLPSREVSELVSLEYLKLNRHVSGACMNKHAAVFVPLVTDIKDTKEHHGWEKVLPSHKRAARVRE